MPTIRTSGPAAARRRASRVVRFVPTPPTAWVTQVDRIGRGPARRDVVPPDRHRDQADLPRVGLQERLRGLDLGLAVVRRGVRAERLGRASDGSGGWTSWWRRAGEVHQLQRRRMSPGPDRPPGRRSRRSWSRCRPGSPPRRSRRARRSTGPWPWPRASPCRGRSWSVVTSRDDGSGGSQRCRPFAGGGAAGARGGASVATRRPQGRCAWTSAECRTQSRHAVRSYRRRSRI